MEPRDFCLEPFSATVTRVTPPSTPAPGDWELCPAPPRVQYAPNSTIFAQDLDLATGLPSGPRETVASGLVRTLPASWGASSSLGNGPEWGGNGWLYWMAAAGVSRRLRAAFRDAAGWHQMDLPDGLDRGMPWPSKDPVTSLLFARHPATAQTGLPYDVAVRLDPMVPATERIIPVPVCARSGGPRFIPGHRKVVFWTLDAADQEIVAIYDYDTESVELVTQAAGLVVDETWTSPDPSEAGYCVWFTDQERDLVCYSKWDGAWLEEGRVNVPSVLAQPEKRILSPEPFEHNGESFIAFQFASGYGSPEGDIYVTTPRASVPCHFRRVSPVTVAPRRKPEPYLLAGRPVVYYLDTAGVDSIWMAETGL